MKAYFSPEGAHLSLTRTHIASCDFSVRNYTYAPVPGDLELKHFSIEPDRTYLLPMIKAAQAVDGADFKILSSPWTSPPWMKDNNTWNGGALKPEFQSTFADYIVKYVQAYQKEGVPIWGSRQSTNRWATMPIGRACISIRSKCGSSSPITLVLRWPKLGWTSRCGFTIRTARPK